MASISVLEEGSLALNRGDKKQVKNLYDRVYNEMLVEIERAASFKRNNLRRNLEVDWCLKLVKDKATKNMIPLRYVILSVLCFLSENTFRNENKNISK